jgi:hypothetical protein
MNFSPIADIQQQGTLVIQSADYQYVAQPPSAVGGSHILRLRLARRGVRFLETIVGRDMAELLEELTTRLGFPLDTAMRLLQGACGIDVSTHKAAKKPQGN